MLNLRPVALLFAGLLASACSGLEPSTETDVEHVEAAPKKPVFAEAAVNVDADFSDAVKVEKDALVIASSKADRRIEVGSVVAGDRSSTPGDDNPLGFLRRVTGIQKKGNVTTYETERAELAEWIREGRVDFRSNESLLPRGKVSLAKKVTTKTLRLQNTSGSGSGKGSISGSLKDTISVENVVIDVKATYDGYLDIQKEWGIVPKGAKFKSWLQIQPSVSADIVWKIANEASVEGSLAGPEMLIPLATPIPMTVRYSPELKCSISASGSLNVTVGANVAANVIVGFEGEGSLNALPSFDNLSRPPELAGGLALKSVDGEATLTTNCEVVGNIELLAFDAVGMKGRMGPYVTLTGAACAKTDAAGPAAGFTLHQVHGFTETIRGSVQVPFLGWGHEEQLYDGKQQMGEGYLHGDAKTCTFPEADSCAGKPDGFYCSELTTFSGYVCEAGQIALGHQCENDTLTCAGGTRESIRCE